MIKNLELLSKQGLIAQIWVLNQKLEKNYQEGFRDGYDSRREEEFIARSEYENLYR